jgi:hypothetical protein
VGKVTLARTKDKHHHKRTRKTFYACLSRRKIYDEVIHIIMWFVEKKMISSFINFHFAFAYPFFHSFWKLTVLSIKKGWDYVLKSLVKGSKQG